MRRAENLVEFAKAMMVLGEAFNEPVSSIRIEAYLAALDDLDATAVLTAMRQCLKTSKFFPRPADIREAANGGPKSDRADLAWGELIKAVKRFGWARHPEFSDPSIMAAIQAVWGSWVSLCETLPNEGPELVGWMKQFKGTYQAVENRVDRETSYAQLPPSIAQALTTIASKKALP